MSFGERFVRFRTSRAFVLTMAGFCAFWLGWNLIPFLPHFDGDDFGRLTLILSVEASLAASFILEDGSRQTDLLLEVLKRIETDVGKVEEGMAEIEEGLSHDS